MIDLDKLCYEYDVDLLIDIYFDSKDGSSCSLEGYDYIITQRPFELWVRIKNISKPTPDFPEKTYNGWIARLSITFGDPSQTIEIVGSRASRKGAKYIDIPIGHTFQQKQGSDINQEISGELLVNLSLYKPVERHINYFKKNNDGGIELILDDYWSQTYLLETERRALKDIKAKNLENETRWRSNLTIGIISTSLILTILFRILN